jgi:hypothetical protein
MFNRKFMLPALLTVALAILFTAGRLDANCGNCQHGGDKAACAQKCSETCKHDCKGDCKGACCDKCKEKCKAHAAKATTEKVEVKTADAKMDCGKCPMMKAGASATVPAGCAMHHAAAADSAKAQVADSAATPK